ncbi:MAG: hypothetical protein ACLR7Z_18740 [Bilophila wadsworthia]
MKKQELAEKAGSPPVITDLVRAKSNHHQTMQKISEVFFDSPPHDAQAL